MAKNTRPLYKINIVSPGFVTLKGTIESLSPKVSITFRYKKPRSSKYALRTVDWDSIISWEGQQGGPGSITFRSDRAIAKSVKGYIEMDEKMGLANITTEEGETFSVKPKFMEAVSEDEIEAPSFEKKNKKKAEAETAEKPKKKKAA